MSYFKISSRVLAVVALLMILPSVHATKLKSQNLEQLVSESQDIITGVVKNVEDGINKKGIPYTKVTISVIQSMKGGISVAKDYSFRQFGLLKPRVMENGHKLLSLTPEGFAKWRKDEHVIAFLYKKAGKTNLQTTVGLAQGKFTIVNKKVVNEFNNNGLFTDLTNNRSLTRSQKTMFEQEGPVDKQSFMDLVATITTAQKVN